MRSKALTQKHIAKLTEYGLFGGFFEACRHLSFEAGETILQEGMQVTYCAIVLKGRAKVCRTSLNGRNLVLCYYVSEGIIGEVELMTGTHQASATVIAITDFECLMIPYHSNISQLKQNNAFMNWVGNQIATKLVNSTDNFVAASLCSGEERLCSYILQASNKEIFNDVLTDVSCLIGVSYRHLFRILNQLCEDKVLEKRESGYLILNSEKLAQKAANALV